MAARGILKLAVKIVAVALLLAAFTAVGYSFGLKGAVKGVKNQGALVNLLGRVKAISKNKVTIQTLETPFEESGRSQKRGIATVGITARTEFTKVENGGTDLLSRPKGVSYSAIKKGNLVTISAILSSNASLTAEKIMVMPSELATGEWLKGSEKSKPPEITNISGIVKEVGDKRFALEVTAGATVNFLVDEGTDYMKGVPAPGGGQKKGSFSDIKVGTKVIAIGEKNLDGSIKAKAVFIEER